MRRSRVLGVTLSVLALGPIAGEASANMGGPVTIIIYGPSLNRSPENEQTLAEDLGYSVTVADEATWSSLSTTDFASYDAIVFGDPNCGSDRRILNAAVENREIWSAAVSGNMEVIGTDPIFHQGVGDALDLVRAGLAFTTAATGTGLYVSLSCYYSSAPPGTRVALLRQIGVFTVQGGSQNPVHITPRGETHPAMAGLTDEGLSGWSYSVHEMFNSFPPEFGVLVKVNTNRLPYILGTPSRP
jgi:hypothetical protein